MTLALHRFLSTLNCGQKRNMIFFLKETWSRKWIEKLSTQQQQWWSLTLGGHGLSSLHWLLLHSKHVFAVAAAANVEERRQEAFPPRLRLDLDWLFNSLPEEALLRASDRERKCSICSLFNLDSHSIFSEFYFFFLNKKPDWLLVWWTESHTWPGFVLLFGQLWPPLLLLGPAGWKLTQDFHLLLTTHTKLSL